MHNRALHAALRAFCEQAAWQLAADGPEVPFDLEEQPGSGPAPLYCYRPRTAHVVVERLGALSRLPTFPPVASALEGVGGLDGYLRARGHATPKGHGARGDAALRAFLAAVWADAPTVEFDAERFERAFAELEASAYAERSLTVVAVAIEGLLLESDEVALADGLVLVRAATLAERPDDLDVGEDDAVALVRLEGAAGEPVPLEDAGRRLRRLQTALRLWDDAEPGLDATAHARIDGGPWFAVGLGTGTRRSRDVCELFEEDEDQLRAFCSLVTRRTPRGGELAWALRRFELGCERAAATDALTDWLLALRALLEPEGPQSGRLGERLAAICALPEHRGALARRVAHLCALERQVITGMARHEPHLDARVSELGGHLRAVLRDVLCGHLDPALCALADELLAGEAADYAADAVPVPES